MTEIKKLNQITANMYGNKKKWLPKYNIPPPEPHFKPRLNVYISDENRYQRIQCFIVKYALQLPSGTGHLLNSQPVHNFVLSVSSLTLYLKDSDRIKTKVCASKMWRFDCSWSYLYNSVIFSLCSKFDKLEKWYVVTGCHSFPYFSF